ncbi:hypothetical protein EDD73_10432 [Heliophilum fasciatum]|uniref:Zinc-ribbon domain-containing protein n=1 Tax=Heliophilum fasciatum TaxID=35700 RepID=A0A4R2RUT9_9FIRM|nr:hypothetical protein EDD73_10432 [Heliophilum fasciatum]
MKTTPAYQVDGGALHYLVRNVYKLPLNSLSPLHSLPEGSQSSTDTMALAEESRCKAMVNVLAQPEIKIEIRQGGHPGPLTVSSVLIKNDRDVAQIVELQKGRSSLTARLFESIDHYGAYFAAQHTTPVNSAPANLLKLTLSLEVLVFMFNLIDCYRRAYLYEMLDHSTNLVEAIYEDEFVSTLQQALKSNDLRWAVPSLLRLVPGLSNSVLEFQSEYLNIAEHLQLFARTVAGESGRRLFCLGSTGKYLGMEFALSWKQASGLEVTLLNNQGQVVSVGRYYLASTDEANHWISLTQLPSKTEFTHLSLTQSETVDEIKNILRKHLSILGEKQKKSDAEVIHKYCIKCGCKLNAGALFCSQCGTKINRDGPSPAMDDL